MKNVSQLVDGNHIGLCHSQPDPKLQRNRQAYRLTEAGGQRDRHPHRVSVEQVRAAVEGRKFGGWVLHDQFDGYALCPTHERLEICRERMQLKVWNVDQRIIRERLDPFRWLTGSNDEPVPLVSADLGGWNVVYDPVVHGFVWKPSKVRGRRHSVWRCINCRPIVGLRCAHNSVEDCWLG